jgi:hypothetical protein
MSAITDFYFTEQLVLYGQRKTQSDIYDVGMGYCINSGFLDQRGQATEAGKNLMRFMDHSLLLQTEELAQA